MSLMVSSLDKTTRQASKWETPGPCRSWDNVAAFARWAARKFCLHVNDFVTFAWCPMDIDDENPVWQPILPNSSFNDLMQHSEIIISCQRLPGPHGERRSCWFIVKAVERESTGECCIT